MFIILLLLACLNKNDGFVTVGFVAVINIRPNLNRLRQNLLDP